MISLTKKLTTMFRNKVYKYIPIVVLPLAVAACKLPVIATRTENKTMPNDYGAAKDSANASRMKWREYFGDPYLLALIDTALRNNQELNITLQEIEIAKNEILFRQGALKPMVNARLGIGVDKVGRYTSQGAGDATTEIKPGKEMPDPLTDFTGGAYASWELDVWKKLRNAKKAAILELENASLVHVADAA